MRSRLLTVIAARGRRLALLLRQAPAGGAPAGGAERAPALGAARHRPRHLAVLRRRRRPGHAPAARQPRAGGDARRLHVGGQHRRVPVGGRRRSRPGPDQHRPGRAAGRRRRSTRSPGSSASTDSCTSGTTPPTARCSQNPGQPDCTRHTPAQDNCWFVSAVDNGWYASGLVEVRQALPARAGPGRPAARADGLLASSTTTAPRPPATPTRRCRATSRPARCTAASTSTRAPRGYHNGALYSDPADRHVHGMGLHQMPGDVWWRTWRTLPPQRCADRPRLLLAGSVAGARLLADLHRPASRASASTSGRATTRTRARR